MSRGPLGFPVIDIEVTLTDGSYHSVDSSDQAFRTAARIGVTEALPQCAPVLLEPIHVVEIVCPTDATAEDQFDPLRTARPDSRLRHP
jgi:elongation factor G